MFLGVLLVCTMALWLREAAARKVHMPWLEPAQDGGQARWADKGAFRAYNAWKAECPGFYVWLNDRIEEQPHGDPDANTYDNTEDNPAGSSTDKVADIFVYLKGHGKKKASACPKKASNSTTAGAWPFITNFVAGADAKTASSNSTAGAWPFITNIAADTEGEVVANIAADTEAEVVADIDTNTHANTIAYEWCGDIRAFGPSPPTMVRYWPPGSSRR